MHIQLSGEQGRITPDNLEDLCPDWRERETFLSGPAEMLDAMTELWEREGDPERLHTERFQPKALAGEPGEGGTIRFLESDTEAESDGSIPILVAGENAGLELAVRVPRGHLPHLHRKALLGTDPRPAKRQGRRNRG